MYQFKYAYQVGWVWGDIYDGIKRLAKLGYQGVEVAGQPEYFLRPSKSVARAVRRESSLLVFALFWTVCIAHP